MTAHAVSIRNLLALSGTAPAGIFEEFSRSCTVLLRKATLEISFPWTVCIDNVGDIRGAVIRSSKIWKPFREPAQDVRLGTSAKFPALATAIRIPRTEDTRAKIVLDSEVFCMKMFSDKWQLQPEHLIAGQADSRLFTGYRIINVENDCGISALAISRANGQFGNHFKQLSNAIHLSKHFGVKRIFLPKMSQFEVPGSRLQIDDLEFIAFNDRSEIKEPALLGTFFYRDAFEELLEQPFSVDQYVDKLFVPLHGIARRPPHHLAVHIRSNDLFDRPDPHPRYPQPPLSFYKLVINEFRKQHPDMHVALVYQDKANPVIDALQAELNQQGISYTVFSGSLTDDLRVLLSHESLVFGRGSFGKAVVNLAPYVKTVYFPWTDKDFSIPVQTKGANGYVVRDVKRRYIAVGDWKNTPDQRQLMIDYPIENLALSPL